MFKNPSRFGYVIMGVIVLFFGFFIGLINLISNADLTFINYFFGGFILLSVGMTFIVFNVFGKSVGGNSQDINNARVKRDEILELLNQSPQTKLKKSKMMQVEKTDVLYCYSCGAHLDTDAIFCPDCGDPTDKERKDAGLLN
jgi:hypothetical protein